MCRLAFILAALLAASPAWAADQWNAGTLTGTGRTETLAYPATCSSTTALAINRRGTSLTNALTKYVTSGAGDLTATAATPASRTNFAKLLAVGCNSTTAIVAGSGIFMESAALSGLSSWTSEEDAASDQGYGGTITATSPDKTWQVGTFFAAGSSSRLFNFNIGPKSNGNIAGSSPLPGDSEIVGISVNANYYCSIAGEYSSGTPTMRGYTSGTSYAYTTTTASVVMNASSYFYPPFGLSATACVATIKRVGNSHTYILAAPIGGTITVTDAGVIDLIPLGDWDPTGSLRRGWWVNKADGTVRVSNSATAPSSVSTNATYDIGSTPLGGSTPLFAITGLDMDGNGATANPVVLMADGTHFAWWGTQPAVAASTPKPSPASPGAGALRALRRMLP